ncbi:heme oxygenase-like protein [Sphingomonas sp. PP-F2F-G114-C0414]|uniref:iron-containing redox enzyme family protein n=1 Tax=Sphingomonas sp. PP-F2F-G114-C0414 TaxID=2135662 RepID=UPI000EF91B09|nr:iron-containing redox enzyme family protein [Sphingomonas sp. PP-F2F-G114-C0414]RMB35761.1 heme oxygenase-like protein [Sphingomonas sp. PP-F2F-G114-C0414]
MEATIVGLSQPKFRLGVTTDIDANEATIRIGKTTCAFAFETAEAPAVACLIAQLVGGGVSIDAMIAGVPEIADKVPALLQGFDAVRLLVESEPGTEGLVSGAQLYREIRRIAERVTQRVARSAFHTALLEHRATREQLIGYALEYFYIVKAAPGLIGPALATARTSRERDLLQGFLKSELGHDAFLARALEAVGLTPEELEAHQPLPTTFALCAALGVYARQHPLSFKAVLFLFEVAQVAFVDAFDDRCRELDLPAAFYLPLRDHADLNADYEHADISRDLMALEGVVDREAAVVVKRNVALMIETMILQEEQILTFYAQPRAAIARIFEDS